MDLEKVDREKTNLASGNIEHKESVLVNFAFLFDVFGVGYHPSFLRVTRH